MSAAIVPGKPDESPLVRFARGDDPAMRMPPKDSDVPPLAEGEIAQLTAWVQAGAVWPDGIDTATVVDKKDHWAFAPVERPAVPAARDGAWPKNDIDRFVLARLDAAGLQPSPEADRRTWLRRATFDLTGLPPTPEEVERFTTDRSPDAHECVIERLLASPRYGERYAQHWLDVVRYADTDGCEVNTERPNAWPYRDYCIAAFNADVPYDRFVREQIAGGEPGSEAATGFLVTAAVLLPGQIGKDDASQRAARQDALNDIIINVSDTILGLTVGCARCHDHKFDPVTARDYYALQAFFAGVEYGDQPFSGPATDTARREQDAARKAFAALEPVAFSGQPRTAVSALLNVDRFAAVTVRRLRFTILESSSLEPCLDELEVYDTSGRNVALAAAGTSASASGSLIAAGVHDLVHVNDGHYGNTRSWLASTRTGAWVTLEFPTPVTIDHVCWSRDRSGQYEDRLATAYRIEVCAESDPADSWTLVADSTDRLPSATTSTRPQADTVSDDDTQTAAIAKERASLRGRLKAATHGMRVFAGIFKSPHAVHLLNRGDAEQRKEVLAPESPATFAGIVPPVRLSMDAPELERRRALAAWLTDPRHPLPARVMVNRIWQWHFGTGLVDTPNDFGRNGSPPSHRELLDWLADEFVKSGWSIKHMHRLIVGSATYRQAGEARSAGLAHDADTRLLWRYPPRRLEAETIRDTMLTVSGRLNPDMGGRGFDLFTTRGGLAGFQPVESFDAAGRRRMIYAHKIRMEKDDVFGAFDCPDAGQSMARRRQSTTPIQALNLFNSPFTIEEARAFAERVTADVAGAAGEPSAGDEAVRRWIDRVFQLSYGRVADPVEMNAAESVVREHGLATLCRVIFNSNEFLFIP